MDMHSKSSRNEIKNSFTEFLKREIISEAERISMYSNFLVEMEKE